MEINGDTADVWDGMRDQVTSLITSPLGGITYEDFMGLYDAVYSASQGHSGSSHTPGQTFRGSVVGIGLYECLKALITEHIVSLGEQMSAEGASGTNLINLYVDAWEKYLLSRKVVDKAFNYLNRYLDEFYPINVLFVLKWAAELFPSIGSRLRQAVLSQIAREREGDDIDSSSLRGVLDSFILVGMDPERPKDIRTDVYIEEFEDGFISSTREYCDGLAQSYLENHSVSEYVVKVEDIIKLEESRVERYLNKSTLSRLTITLNESLIVNQIEAFQHEFEAQLKVSKVDSLKKLYKLLVRVPSSLEVLRKALEAQALSAGLAAVKELIGGNVDDGNDNDKNDGESDEAKKKANREIVSSIDPKAYVEALLHVHRHYRTMIDDALNKDHGFETALDQACMKFINDNAVCRLAKKTSKSPELLARYTDSLLKKSNKDTEEKLQQSLDDVITVFRYVEDKDVFLTFFRKLFCRRLIHGLSFSEDAEGSFINRLKSYQGFDFTTKLDHMYRDMALSRDLNEMFREQQPDLPIKCNIQVLTTEAWPLEPPKTDFQPPSVIQQCMDAFTALHSQRHKGRKLSWLHQEARGELKAKFSSSANAAAAANSRYTIVCTTFQMGILLMYNDQNTYSIEQLQEGTRLNNDVLNGVVEVLLHSKILLSDGESSSSSGHQMLPRSTQLTLNPKFKSKRARIVLAANTKREKDKESTHVHEGVLEERKLLVQAAIVRVMKTRKVLAHNMLIQEVIGQLKSRFQPDVKIIKKCISVLIDRDYLKRKEGGGSDYEYIA